MKHVDCYFCLLIDDIFLDLFCFPTMVNTIHSFLFSISWKVWTCLNFTVNWNQFLICWKCQIFCYYITQLDAFKKSNSINEWCNARFTDSIDFVILQEHCATRSFTFFEEIEGISPGDYFFVFHDICCFLISIP